MFRTGKSIIFSWFVAIVKTEQHGDMNLYTFQFEVNPFYSEKMNRKVLAISWAVTTITTYETNT